MAYAAEAVERAMKRQEVILQGMSGKYTWWQVAEILNVSPRTVRRWRVWWQKCGYRGLFDRRRQTPSPKRAPLAAVERVLSLYRERYTGFNVRHFHEIARREHGVKLSYSFVKKALQEARLVKKYKPRGRHRRRREARACLGEMLHLDGSPHVWLASSPEERQTLIAVVDDATSSLLYAKLHEAESSQAVMAALAEVIATHGLPQTLYTDRAGWAVHTPKAGGPYDAQRLTQVGRALERLGIEHVLAYSPQARGRSERVNRTVQGRLVNELRLAGIRTLQDANHYLRQRFVPRYNQTFAHPPREAASAFVPLGQVDLDQILCHEEERTVGQDNTVIFGKVRLQLDKQTGRRTCAGLRVLVRRQLDGTHSVWRGPRCFGRFSPDGQTRRLRPVEAAGPVDAEKRAHRNLGRLLHPAGVHSSHKAATPLFS